MKTSEKFLFFAMIFSAPHMGRMGIVWGVAYAGISLYHLWKGE